MMSHQPELHALLTEARRVQIEHGHAKHVPCDGEGRVCMQGALQVAMVGWDERHSSTDSRTLILSSLAAKAMGFEGIIDMCRFNNDPMTTLEDVVKRFDQGIRVTAPDSDPVAAAA